MEHISAAREDLLTFGYIKEYHSKNNIDLPPDDLILLFVAWISNENMKCWWYRDPSGKEQGPYPAAYMNLWFQQGYFCMNMHVKNISNAPFASLKTYFHHGIPGMYHSICLRYS